MLWSGRSPRGELEDGGQTLLSLSSTAPPSEHLTTMIKIAVLFPLVALLPLASAQLPASAPHCVATCLQAKINEAGSLAPGVQPTDVAGLCATSAFVEAYDNCLSENCVSVGLPLFPA